MHNWHQIESDFCDFDGSLKEYASHRGISYGTLRRRAAKGEWLEKRKAHQKEVASLAAQKITEKKADSLAEQIAAANARDLETVAALNERLSILLSQEDIKIADLRAAALAAKTIQEIARIALGADKQNEEIDNQPIRIILDDGIDDPPCSPSWEG